MLVLSRSKGQGISLPALGVCVEVMSVGRKVKLGVTAPREVRVLRNELLEHGFSHGLLRHSDSKPRESEPTTTQRLCSCVRECLHQIGRDETSSTERAELYGVLQSVVDQLAKSLDMPLVTDEHFLPPDYVSDDANGAHNIVEYNLDS